MALYVREGFSVIEFGAGNDKIASLWIRTGGRPTIRISCWWSVTYKDEKMDEVFCEQLAEVEQLPSLVLMGDFSSLI